MLLPPCPTNLLAARLAQVTELAPLAMLPSFLLRRKVLRPMATMVGGTMLAAALAMRHGWAINLGGGMHHAWRDQVCAHAHVQVCAGANACMHVCMRVCVFFCICRPAGESSCSTAVPLLQLPNPTQGGGWCAYADLTLALRRLRAAWSRTGRTCRSARR